MKRYFLSPHVYACETGAGAVLLDARSQRYIAIGPQQLQTLRHIVRNWPGSKEADPAPPADPDQLAAIWLRRGLLTTEPPDSQDLARCEPSVEQPARELGLADVLSARSTATHAVRTFLAWASASYALRARRFGAVVSTVRGRKAQQAPHQDSSPAAMTELAAIFCKLRPLFFTTRAACLLDSLTLIELLAQYGHYPQWIIAVSSPPFAAHSWVQLGDMVLNDALERITTYRPILVV